MVTDTGPLARALDVAQRHWPEMRRSRSVVELARIGAETLEQSEQAEAAAHSQAVRALADFAGTFPPGYLAELRSEWPE
jgi:hypothetical protein